MRQVTLYGRPDCHLCDDAREVLLRLRRELPFALLEQDISEDEALHRAYFERIPVITVDGRELCHFFVDEPLLRGALAGRKGPEDDLQSDA